MAGFTKVTVNLPSELVDQLKAAASKRGTTVTEQMRRGLQTDLYLGDAEDKGGKVLVKQANDEVVQIVRK